MNSQIPRSMADEHISELRRQAAMAATGTRRDRDRDHGRTPRLRRRIAFALIDTGSRMLATAQAVPGKPLAARPWAAPGSESRAPRTRFWA